MDMEGPSPTSYIPCPHTSQVGRHMDLLKMQLGRGKIIASISELLKIFLKFWNWNILFSPKNAKYLPNSKSDSLHTVILFTLLDTMDIQWITNERQFRKHNPPSFLDLVLKIQQGQGSQSGLLLSLSSRTVDSRAHQDYLRPAAPHQQGIYAQCKSLSTDVCELSPNKNLSPNWINQLGESANGLLFGHEKRAFPL